jgi:hypothetical protein
MSKSAFRCCTSVCAPYLGFTVPNNGIGNRGFPQRIYKHLQPKNIVPLYSRILVRFCFSREGVLETLQHLQKLTSYGREFDVVLFWSLDRCSTSASKVA